MPLNNNNNNNNDTIFIIGLLQGLGKVLDAKSSVDEWSSSTPSSALPSAERWINWLLALTQAYWVSLTSSFTSLGQFSYISNAGIRLKELCHNCSLPPESAPPI
jgi:hypothetical protein